MDEERDRFFKRQASRFTKSTSRKVVTFEGDTLSTQVEQSKQKSSQFNQNLNRASSLIEEKGTRTAGNLSVGTVELLKRLLGVSALDFQQLLRDKSLRQEMRKEERRLVKIRTDSKSGQESDAELSLLVLNNLLSVSEEVIAGFVREKEPKVVESKARLNQINEITRQLTAIDELMTQGNFIGVKTATQTLFKRFAKDEVLQEKIGYLTFIQTLSEEYERETVLLREVSGYLERLSGVDAAPEGVSTAVANLKNLKKELAIVLNREGKKQEPNARVVAVATQADRLDGLLLSLIEPKTEKKVGDSRYRKEEESKGEQWEQGVRYCKELLEKSQMRQQFYKQLDGLRRNKKRSVEAPYNLLLRFYDMILGQRKETADLGLYLKATGALYQRKNVGGEALLLELKKVEEKYQTNELVASIRPNLESLIVSVQQRERLGKESSAAQVELRKLKKENERLEKLVQQLKTRGGQVEKLDKKKQMQEKRGRDAERIKLEKEEKELQKSLEGIYANLAEKKWKICKNAINAFVKRYEESTNSLAVRSLQSVTAILAVLQQYELAESQLAQYERKEKLAVSARDKDREAIQEKLRQSEEYEGVVKDLLLNFQQDKYPFKKYFDDLRKDKKRAIQERYVVLGRLEEPLGFWRTKKTGEQTDSKLSSLNYSSFSVAQAELEKLRSQREELKELLESERVKFGELQRKLRASQLKLSEITKEIEQIVNLATREGDFKTIPTLKSSALKGVYSLIEKSRESELQLLQYRVSESQSQEQQQMVANVFREAEDLIRNSEFWLVPNFWQERLAAYRGVVVCERLIACLSLLTQKANLRISEESRVTMHSIESEGVNLTGSVRQIAGERGRQYFLNVEDSSSKKSGDLKSSRRSSKSREKESSSKLKETVEQYIQDERKLLNKIGELDEQRQNLEMIIANIQKSLEESEGAREVERREAEDARFALEKVRVQLTERVNELQGEIEISEGRRNELEVRYETDLEYYREMHSELSQRLTQAKEREGLLLKENESLKGEKEMLLKKFEVDLEGIQKEMKEEVDMLKQQLEVYKLSLQGVSAKGQYTESSRSRMEESEGQYIELLATNQRLQATIVQLQSQKAEIQHSLSEHYESTIRNLEREIVILRATLEEEGRIKAEQRESYWLNVLLPQKQKQWQQRNLVLVDSRKQKVFQRASESIDQGQALQTSTQTVDMQKAIEEWKAQNMPLIIQRETAAAIRNFIDTQLPIILDQEYRNWVPPQTDSASEEQILQRQRQLWQQQRKQADGRREQEFAARIAEFQQTLSRRFADKEARWREVELPLLLQREREQSLAEFREKELPKFVQEVQEDWSRRNQQHVQLNVKDRQLESNSETQVLHAQIEGLRHELQVQRQAWGEQREAEIKEKERQRLLHEEQLLRLRKEIVSQGPSVATVQSAFDLAQWQRRKEEQLVQRGREIDNYWLSVILPQKEQEWRSSQGEFVERIVVERLMQQEAEFRERVIPGVLREERTAWEAEIAHIIQAQRQEWFEELPQLLQSPTCRNMIEPYLQSQAREYEEIIRRAEGDRVRAEQVIRQLETQLGSYETSINQLRQQLSQMREQKSVQQTRQTERQVQELQKVIGRQRDEIAGLSELLKEHSSLKQEYFAQREAFIMLQNSKIKEISDIRANLEGQLVQLANENNVLLSQLAQVQSQPSSREGDKQAYFVLQRQAESLNSALGAKESELTFLRKMNQNLRVQITELQNRVSNQMSNGQSERVMSQIRGSNIELSYENKYLKEREEALLKKVEFKEQELVGLRKKYDYQNEILEKKLKSSLQASSALQIRKTELESELGIRGKEVLNLSNEVERLRFDFDKVQAQVRLLSTENQSLRRQLRERESQLVSLQGENDKNVQSLRRGKVQEMQWEQERESVYRRQLQDRDALIQSQESEKASLRNEVQKLTNEISKLWAQADERESVRRRESQRASRYQLQIHRLQEHRGREVEVGELQVLSTINREVTELTNANKQLELKLVLIENRERIGSFAREVVSYFLTLQRYCDALVDYLLAEGIIASQQIYTQFLSKSRNFLEKGQLQEYFGLWYESFRGLFVSAVSSRAEEMRVQASELMRLKEEMNEVLDRQIEMSQGSASVQVEQYREVLSDITAIIQEYRRTGNVQHLETLYRTLGLV